MTDKNKLVSILLCVLTALTIMNSVMIFLLFFKVQEIQYFPPVIVNEIASAATNETAETTASHREEQTEKDVTQPITTDKAVEDEEMPSEEADSTYCYITSSGTKYHRDGCSYLKKSKTKLTLSEAKSNGYSPCSRCY